MQGLLLLRSGFETMSLSRWGEGGVKNDSRNDEFCRTIELTIGTILVRNWWSGVASGLNDTIRRSNLM